jgi:hypothetical protein
MQVCFHLKTGIYRMTNDLIVDYLFPGLGFRPAIRAIFIDRV